MNQINPKASTNRRPKRSQWKERSPVRFARISKPNGERITVSLSGEVVEKLNFPERVSVSIYGSLYTLTASESKSDYAVRRINYGATTVTNASFVSFLVRGDEIREWLKNLPPEAEIDITKYKIKGNTIQFNLNDAT